MRGLMAKEGIVQHIRNMVIIKTFSIKNAIYFRTLNIFSDKINLIVAFYQSRWPTRISGINRHVQFYWLNRLERCSRKLKPREYNPIMVRSCPKSNLLFQRRHIAVDVTVERS